ncbi:MAG TPA: MFS transporter [bacterium]|nr:MFS transporter [bacterium]
MTKSMLDLNTIFPALVTSLVDSTTLFGFLYAIMLGVPFIFNIFFGHYLQSRELKKPYLLTGIYLRSFSYLGMAVVIYFFAEQAPVMVLASLFGWIFLFSFSGGFAGVSYADIIGKLVPRGRRGRLYASKQFAGGVATLVGGILIARIFSVEGISYPANYALILFIGWGGLVIASVAFWLIREPATETVSIARESFRTFLARVPGILRNDPAFLRFLIAENMASFSLMMLPFYMIFARETFQLGQEYVGRYLLFQIGGMILSNLFWGMLSGRQGSKAVVRTCILIGGLIPVAAIILQGWGPDLFATIFVLIGFVMSGRRVGFEPYLLDLAPEEKRTLYLGMNGTLNFSKVLLPVLGGGFIDLFGFHITFLLVTSIMLLAFFVLGESRKYGQGE